MKLSSREIKAAFLTIVVITCMVLIIKLSAVYPEEAIKLTLIITGIIILIAISTAIYIVIYNILK